MIDVVHTKQGKSFTGLVAYLMEGSKGSENPDRVAWTDTRHLATQKPVLAAKVMAATALDQPRLKQNAGVSNAGRKSNNHVLHYSLAWPRGQEVTREEMLEAVNGSLAVLGEKAGQKGGRKGKQGRVASRDQFASEHQVLIVAHSDSEHAHCHIVCNRVHPRHGVMLPSSNDFLKLSRWAEKFEREHGGLVVDQRAIHNEARDKGQKVYNQKRSARDQFELEQDARDNHPEALEIQKEQRAKNAILARRSAEVREKGKQGWRELEQTQRQGLVALREVAALQVNTESRAIQQRFAEKWRGLHHQQHDATETFEKSEDSLLGKARNALGSLLSLKSGVNVLWSQGARIEAFEKGKEQQKCELDRQERKEKEAVARRIRQEQRRQKLLLGHRYAIQREELILRSKMDKAALRAAWKEREKQRKSAWEQHRIRMAARPPEQSFGRQTSNIDQRTRELIESAQKLTLKRQAKAKDRDDRSARDLGDDGRSR